MSEEEPEEIKTLKADSRGRVNLGTDYADTNVKVAVLEHGDMFGVTKRYQVAPSFPGSDKWEVTEGFQTLSTHDKKSAAKRKAKRLAEEGDKLTIRDSDGQIQTSKTI